MTGERKIFFVVASGGQATPQHYFDTIKNKRTVDEASQFLSTEEATKLKEKMHGQPFSVWGAVPGDRNIPTWESMNEGDYLLIYRGGKIILASEVAIKVRNPQLARHYWDEDANGKTWELMFFLYNDVEVDIPMNKINKYFNYAENYHPQGFMAIDQNKVNVVLSHYGDLLSFLTKIQSGQEPEEIDLDLIKKYENIIDDKVERAPTEHSEMQWRLIRLGNKCNFDVWVPNSDQGLEYDGNKFRDHVLKDFNETIDVPKYIKNIDTVWKLGYSIKSAFEIENSTAVYSGLLRLSDLRALAPNSNYPLFIVADDKKRDKFRREVERPTFSNDYLQLDEVVKFLSYKKVRELDDNLKGENVGFDLKWLVEQL